MIQPNAAAQNALPMSRRAPRKSPKPPVAQLLAVGLVLVVAMHVAPANPRRTATNTDDRGGAATITIERSWHADCTLDTR